MKIIVLFKKYFYNVAIVLNLGLALLLMLSYLCAFISPHYFYPLAFIGLIYPFLLILNLVFSIFWIFRKAKLFTISGLTILLGWSFITRFVQITVFDKSPKTKQDMVKVISYNVRIFNQWNWTSDKNSASKIFNFIKKNKPNLLCIQEFYSKDIIGKNAKDSILHNSTLKFKYISYTSGKKKKGNNGIATFTCYPIIMQGNIKIDETDNYCIFTDVVIDSDTLRIYNIHLESIHLVYKDHYLIDNIENNDTLDVPGLKSIYWKFKKSYKKRALQVKSIVKHIDKCKYPVIMCGDFNDTPVSYVYQQLTSNLDDAFKISGNGVGYTYINRYRTFRIDYILHSPELESFDFKVSHVTYSDHFPVMCSFSLNNLK